MYQSYRNKLHDEKEVKLILELATGLLPEKPVWAVLQDCGGLFIGALHVDDVDSLVATIAASNALCERTVGRAGHGDFRYVFMFGDEGIYFAIRLNSMEDMLGLGFESLASVDSIINSLPEMVTVLNSLLLE